MPETFNSLRDKLAARIARLNRRGWTYRNMSEATGVPLHVFEKWMSPALQRAPRDIERLDEVLEGVRVMEKWTPDAEGVALARADLLR